MNIHLFQTARSRIGKFQNRLCVCIFGVLPLALGLCTSLCASPVDLLKFHSPSFEEPFFRIHFPFVVEGNKVVIKNLELNGANPGPFLIFKDGKSIAASAPLEAGVYTIDLDYAWGGGKPYKAKLVYGPENGEESKSLEFSGISPQKGGIPGGRAGFYRVYQVEEEVGIARNQEVVTFTLIAPRAELDPADIVIFDGANAVPFEIMERMESVPPESVSATHPQTSTLKIVLSISAEACEKKLLLVLKGEQRPAPAQAFTISGEGLGKTIKGSALALELHPQSGQINTIESFETGVKLFNKAGVIHWNPDVFVPGVAWDHSFDWNPPAVFEEKAGSYLYINSRRGPLPRVKGVRLEVKYIFPSEAPYVVSETRLNFDRGMGVIAVRNDEMVLFRELFDSLLYEDKNGKIIKLPLKEKEATPFGLVHIAPEDLGWVGLVNSREGFGFFSLRLQAAHGNFEIPGEFLHKAGTCFYAPADGNYVYWVRPLIYTWSNYFTNTYLAFVPKGSFFYEKNAYIIMQLGDDLPQKLDSLLKILRHPLRVF